MKALDFDTPVYIGPRGLPFYWRDEASGMLKDAIEQYIYWAARQSSTKPNEIQFDLIKKYLRYWIEAPCWKGPTKKLVQQLKSVNRVEELEGWLSNCLEHGLDPL